VSKGSWRPDPPLGKWGAAAPGGKRHRGPSLVGESPTNGRSSAKELAALGGSGAGARIPLQLQCFRAVPSNWAPMQFKF